MAVEIIEQRLDDIYRSKNVRRPADVTVPFSYKGRDYMIDLTTGNEREFDDAIEPFLEAATEVTGRRKGSTAKKAAPVAATTVPKKKATAKPSNAHTEAIREWARGQGIQVSDRGRIADSVKKAYYAGHPKAEEAHVSTLPERTHSMEDSAVSVELEDDEQEPEVEETDAEGDYEELYSQI